MGEGNHALMTERVVRVGLQLPNTATVYAKGGWDLRVTRE